MLSIMNNLTNVYFFNKRLFTVAFIVIVAIVITALLITPHLVVMAGPAGSGIDHCSC